MAKKRPVTTKRKVKNPETFRDRALKANESEDTPKRRARLRKAGGRIASPVARPVKKAARKVAKIRVLKPVFVVLRFLGKIILPVYVRNSWRELRQVTWPNWEKSRRLTGAVLIFAAIFGATVSVVDYVLDKVFKSLLL